MNQPARPKLLIIEDDLGLQRQMRWSLDQFEAVFADDHDSALAQLRRHEPAVATLDLGLPPSKDTPDEGFRTLRDMLALTPSLKVIALTGQSDHANAIRSIGLGAVDFFSKPFEPDKLGVMIERAFHVADLERDQRRADRVQTSEPLPGLITRDPAMLRLARQVERLAPLPAGVLLHGESGTGKELFARALHELSPRKSRKFVAINCAAIPESLLESELFGYERGAFTGANRQTPGKIELADGGTLFLDEIGDMPLSLQPKLLRFLQERVVERIGSREGIPVKVRVICATHRDLRQMMREGLFREDLYYRLGEVTLDIPPLRERIGDAIALAHAFARRFAGEYGMSRLGFTDDAVAAIESHGWPGNVRELENCIKRAAIFAEGGTMSATDLGLQADTATESLNLRQLRDEFEKTIVLRALARVDGNIARAAELLGVSRPTIYDLLNRLELRLERPAKGIGPNQDPADQRKSDR